MHDTITKDTVSIERSLTKALSMARFAFCKASYNNIYTVIITEAFLYQLNKGFSPFLV